jgi:hypothetical protein
VTPRQIRHAAVHRGEIFGIEYARICNLRPIVILRRSPFFTASLEGWPQARMRRSFDAAQRSAAPQDDGGERG